MVTGVFCYSALFFHHFVEFDSFFDADVNFLTEIVEESVHFLDLSELCFLLFADLYFLDMVTCTLDARSDTSLL